MEFEDYYNVSCFLKMASPKEKILITGGLGFIGSNLAKYCLQLGMKVTIYDNLDKNSGGNLSNIEPFKDNVELINDDIINYEPLSKVISDKDLIINCAASTSHPFSMMEPWINLDVNIRGVINILESIRTLNPDASFVHLGTSTQLGPLHYQPADELHPEFPLDIYSANKTVAEKYVLLYSKVYGLRGTVLRLSNTFGPRAAIHSSEFTFNNYFIGLALQNKKITVYKPGTQLRNLIYVDDAVEALILAGTSKKTSGETFFAVGDGHMTVLDIANKISQYLGGNVELVDYPKERESIEIGDAILCNKKIKRILGWNPKIELSEGLVRTGKYYDECLEDYLK